MYFPSKWKCEYKRPLKPSKIFHPRIQIIKVRNKVSKISQEKNPVTPNMIKVISPERLLTTVKKGGDDGEIIHTKSNYVKFH